MNSKYITKNPLATFYFNFARKTCAPNGEFMARINIDDKLLSDERFLVVCDKIGRFTAMGQFYYITKLAQRYWVDDSKAIPKNVYAMSDFSDAFILSGLVAEKDGGYYLAGSKDSFKWLVALKDNSAKGGDATKNKYLRKPTGGQDIAKREPDDSPLYSLLSTPYSLLPTQTKKQKTVSVKFDFETLYQNHYPKKEGKKKGIETLNKTIKTQDEFDNFNQAIKNYVKKLVRDGTEKRYVKKFSTFANDWEDFIELEDDGEILSEDFKRVFASMQEAQAKVDSPDFEGVY